MSKYSDGVYSVGDPIEVEMYETLNVRGDHRISWIPATVVGVSPLAVAFADSSFLVLHPGIRHRIPEWKFKRAS